MSRQIYSTKNLIFLLVFSLIASVQAGDALYIDQTVANWTNLNPKVSPPQKNHLTLSYDSYAERLILFSGRNLNGTILDDTWSYSMDDNLWEYMDPVNSPPGRQYSDMTYIPGINKSAVFGGANSGGLALGDFWLYDYASNSWEELITEGGPSKRSFHKMAYSPVNNVLVISGGNSGPEQYSDTWFYDFDTNQWTEMGHLHYPVRMHAMVYNPVRNSMLLYHGGMDNLIVELNFTSLTWEIVETTNSPGEYKYMLDMVYDPVIDKFILFGGYTDTEGTDETWLFDYNTRTWYLLETENSPPPRHTDSNVEYDTVNNITMLYGGSDETIYYDDTWSLSIPSDIDVSTMPTIVTHAVPSVSSTDSETTKSLFPSQLLISLILIPIIRRKLTR